MLNKMGNKRLAVKSTGDVGLQAIQRGAFDYLPKPFELAILIARIKGLLRRKEWFTAAPPAAADVAEADANRIEWAGRVIDLSPAAARAIGVSGLAPVSLRVVGGV